MDVFPYQKVLNYLCLLGFISIVVIGIVGLFITHAEQPTMYSIASILFLTLISVIVTGYMKLRVLRKEGQRKRWYQQLEITGGLAFICMILSFPTVSIFDALFRAHPLRIVYYLEMATLFFWAFLAIFFFGLYLKSKFDEEKKDESEMEQKSYIKGKDHLKW